MIRTYKSFSQKKSGSVILVVLMLTAFCTIILTLFLENALDDAKYRQQMQSSTRLKIEAYSFLDLALSFLDKYKQDSNAEKLSGENPPIQKGTNKLIFDSEILEGSPSDSLISHYITKKITEKLGDFSSEHPSFALSFIADNQFRHGDFTIQYEFEDLSAKIPLCKEFNDYSSNLLQAMFNTLSSGMERTLGFSEKGNLENFIINQNHSFIKWEAVEQIARGENSEGSSSSSFNITPLKQWFTIEPSIIKDAKNKKFKINILNTRPEILDTISKSKGNLSMPSKTIGNFDNLINTNSLGSYCSSEIQFFSLTIRVSLGDNNSCTIRCICDCPANSNTSSSKAPQPNNAPPNSGTPGLKRLPFNINKIEEI